MKSLELNSIGNFDYWNPQKLKELQEGEIRRELGHELILENDYVLIWEIVLVPKERLPFRMHKLAYAWNCSSGGMVISRCDSGKISLIHLEDGDIYYIDPKEDCLIRDLENVGDTIIHVMVVEFKETKISSIPEELSF